MEDWFQQHNIPEEEKAIIAEDTLTKNAFWNWDLEANFWLEDHPSDASWTDMKEILREEYVVEAEKNGKDYVESNAKPEPRRLIFATSPNHKVKLKKSHDPKPNQESKLIIKVTTEPNSQEGAKGVQVDPTIQVTAQEQSTKPSPKVHEKKKPSKSSKPLKPVDSICYRCHEKGHFAVTCPTRLVVTSQSLEVNLESTSEVVDELLCKFPTSGIMHLSWPKDDYVGLNKDQEDVGSRITQEVSIPDPEPQAGPKPVTSSPLKQEAVSVHAHDEVQNNLNELLYSVFDTSKATMMCLSSSKRYETGTSLSKEPMMQKVVLKKDDDSPPKKQSLLHNFSEEDGISTSSILLQEEPPDQSSDRQSVPMDAPIKLPNQVSATIPYSKIDHLDIVQTDLSCPDKFGKGLGCLENYFKHTDCLRSHLEEKQEISPSAETGILQTDLNADYSMTAITHLSFAKNVESMAGIKAEGSIGDQPKGKIKPDRTRGVIISYLFKEEPPDAPCITKPKSYQGKTLESQRRMKPDLLYLGASGYTVSRSKPFQEGGNVTALKSMAGPEANQTFQTGQLRSTSDRGSVKEGYLTNQEEVLGETNFKRKPTHPFIRGAWNHQKILAEQEVMNFRSWRFSSPSVCEYQYLEEELSPTKKRIIPRPIMEFKRDLLWIQEAQNQEKRTSQTKVITSFPKPVIRSRLWKDCLILWSNPFQTEIRQPGYNPDKPRLPEEQPSQPGVPLFTLPYTSKHGNKKICIYNYLPFPNLFFLARINDQRLFPFKPEDTKANVSLFINQRLLFRGYKTKISRYKIRSSKWLQISLTASLLKTKTISFIFVYFLSFLKH